MLQLGLNKYVLHFNILIDFNNAMNRFWHEITGGWNTQNDFLCAEIRMSDGPVKMLLPSRLSMMMNASITSSWFQGQFAVIIVLFGRLSFGRSSCNSWFGIGVFMQVFFDSEPWAFLFKHRSIAWMRDCINPVNDICYYLLCTIIQWLYLPWIKTWNNLSAHSRNHRGCWSQKLLVSEGTNHCYNCVS